MLSMHLDGHMSVRRVRKPPRNSLWGHTRTTEGLYGYLCVSTTTSKKEEEGRESKKDEEREVPDPRESIEDTPTIRFHQLSSKSDSREPDFEQNT